MITISDIQIVFVDFVVRMTFAIKFENLFID